MLQQRYLCKRRSRNTCSICAESSLHSVPVGCSDEVKKSLRAFARHRTLSRVMAAQSWHVRRLSTPIRLVRASRACGELSRSGGHYLHCTWLGLNFQGLGRFSSCSAPQRSWPLVPRFATFACQKGIPLTKSASSQPLWHTALRPRDR
jgi:hypothetical protein